MTVHHDRLAAFLQRERDLAARGVKRGQEIPAQTPVTRPAKLLPVDWRVLERLAGYGPRGIWPGVPELAAKLGVCARTVQRSLRRLEAAGRVERADVFENPDDENWTRRGRRIQHLGRQTTSLYRVTGPGDTTIDRISRNAAAQAPVTRPKSDTARVTPRTRVSGSSGKRRYQRPTRSDRPPLTPAQQQTARELPWYREWLLAHGRTREEVAGARRPRAPPAASRRPHHARRSLTDDRYDAVRRRHPG